MKVKDIRQLLKGVRGDVELHVCSEISDCEIAAIVLRDADGNCSPSIGKARYAVIYIKRVGQ